MTITINIPDEHDLEVATSLGYKEGTLTPKQFVKAEIIKILKQRHAFHKRRAAIIQASKEINSINIQ